MGRHRAAAPRGTRPPSPLLVGGAALVVLALVVIGFVAWPSGDDSPSTDRAVPSTSGGTAGRATGTGTPTPSRTRPGAATSTAAAPTTPAPRTTPPAPPAADPPTLAFAVVGRSSYLTIRVPGGPTLVSRTFRKSERGRSDRPVVEVVVGNSAAVRFTLNGQPRRPGAVGQVEKFTVRRR